MDKEKTILNYMKSLNISRDEALQLWEDDKEDFIGEEGEQLQAAAKQIQHREKSDKPRKSNKKERKVDTIKKELINKVAALLEQLDDTKILNIKTETEITFTHNGDTYTWKLTKHRPPK